MPKGLQRIYGDGDFRRIPCLCLLALALVLSVAPLAGAQTQLGELRGWVEDSNGSVYVCKTCTVKVSGNGMEKTVLLDQVGMFRFQLNARIYNLTTDIPGVYPVRRAPIQLKVGEIATVTLVPLVRVVTIGTEITENGDRTFREIAKQPSMEKLEVGSQPQLPAVIEFDSKQTRGNDVIYTNPVLSYGTLTIYADTLTYNTLSKAFQGRGTKVKVDYGGSRQTGTQVEGKLDPQSVCFTVK